ncbi:MAG: hypothetical protein K6G30_12300 [Acetatifactor sp.]|nr:hypothetical protein [Acetatifactor sp.]
MNKRLSYILKLITVLSAVTGTFLSAYAGRNSFMGGSRVFMYFTIQSAVILLIDCRIRLSGDCGLDKKSCR